MKDVTVTNDGATILKLLEVEHPAARVLVDLAQLQDAEVGDGTTSVVCIFLLSSNLFFRSYVSNHFFCLGYRCCRIIEKRRRISEAKNSPDEYHCWL